MDDASNVQRAIKNDITNFDFASPRGVQDITGVDKSAIERLLLLSDFSGTFTGVFNNTVNQSHDVFKTVPSSTSPARLISLTVSGSNFNNTCILTDYKLTRAANGAFTFSVPFSLQSGTVPAWS